MTNELYLNKAFFFFLTKVNERGNVISRNDKGRNNSCIGVRCGYKIHTYIQILKRKSENISFKSFVLQVKLRPECLITCSRSEGTLEVDEG